MNTTKTYVISHLDLDGYGCNIVAKRYLGHDIPICNVNYDDLVHAIVDVPRDARLIISDISIPENLAGLLEEFAKVVILDHHKSTEWAIGWAERTGNKAIVSEDRCATWWFYEFMAEEYKYRDSLLDEWVKYIDDYDRYIHAYPQSRRLNALFYISDRDRFVNDALSLSPDAMLLRNKERIDRYFAQQKEYIEKCTAYSITEDGSTVAVFAEKYKSAIAETLFDRCKEVNLVYIIDMHNNAYSIRSRDGAGIDCSALAKQIHPEGGGHPEASGASFNILGWTTECHKRGEQNGCMRFAPWFDIPIKRKEE